MANQVAPLPGDPSSSSGVAADQTPVSRAAKMLPSLSPEDSTGSGTPPRSSPGIDGAEASTGIGVSPLTRSPQANA
eukprot:2131371-Pyramimonas_sp.AAC.1